MQKKCKSKFLRKLTGLQGSIDLESYYQFPKSPLLQNLFCTYAVCGVPCLPFSYLDVAR